MESRFISSGARLPERNDMTFLTDPRGFAAAEFAAYCAGLDWREGWRPSFVTLHNTAEPNLAQWAHFGAGLKNGAQRVRNLNAYYRGKGWHSGPHLFVAPDFIWLACDLERDGVHASCFNRTSIGVEMVGDYATEAFDSGDGAKVRDNAVAAVAAIYRALRIAPTTLRFHKECLRDRHACPGAHVDKADFIARVQQAMRS
ncbi:N-acetylmuramoyl-L-alanine amidase [Rhodoblastus acidophilus]|nr:N-acetylmuramoyl-L-alanine amidase [Rhodoblastus acidophilus]RAI17087.1 N-acetylmuramoyl-L-alanine amidase [Rhodoblastus acidophilus]